MRLTVGKTRGFVIQGSFEELLFASNLPGTSFREQERVVRIPATLNSWKILRQVEFDSICSVAYKLMREFRKEWTHRRRQLRTATRRFKTLGVSDIPVPLKTVPMEHQVRAFGFSSSIPESALFMDMGTGKTLVAIAIAGIRSLEKVFKVLVVCPKAVKPVWPSELTKHAQFPWNHSIDSPPELKPGANFWITNYDRVKRELRRIKKWKPDMVILDESHKIKNRKASRTKAVKSIQSEFKLLMSGSPFGKCISEVWSQINWLLPAVFGSFSEFKDRYLKMGGYMGYKVVGYKNEDEFAEKLHSLAFRVKKSECLDLPPMSYQKIWVESDRKTRTIYQELDLNLFLEIDNKEVTVDREISKQMKLRQITGGLVRSDDDSLLHVSNLKLAALEDFLEDRGDKKTVIFFSFTHEIRLVEKLCQKLKMGYLTLEGATKDKDRNVFEARFQKDPDIQLALINIQTGAEGLTLTAADYALFYSPSFSFIWYIQARDRISRIGQMFPTTIGFLIMKDTVDEHVVNVLECNGQLVDTYLEDKRSYSIGESKMAKQVEGFTASHLAEELGISAADLRKHLRAIGATKPEGGWVWGKSTDKALTDIRKQVKARIAEEGKKEGKKAPAKSEPAATKKAPAKKAGKAEAAPEEKAPAKKVVRKVGKKAD